MMSETDLARRLHEALSQTTTGTGEPTKVSSQTQEYASGLIAALKAGTVSHAPGTITGVTAPGAPLADGAGTNGMMVLTPAPMIAKTAVATHPMATANYAKENKAIVLYIMTFGRVVFEAGNIVGQCTSTPLSGGPLTAGAGTGGKITALSGSAATAFVTAQLGYSGPDMIKHYTALVKYLMDKAEVTYTAGQVVGTCPPGGGPLGAGAGTGGKIT
jgi:hypothetical protein